MHYSYNELEFFLFQSKAVGRYGQSDRTALAAKVWWKPCGCPDINGSGRRVGNKKKPIEVAGYFGFLPAPQLC